MKFNRRSNQTAKIVFLLLILAIGIGYAYLTSNLSITGSTTFAGNTWDIHFANVQESSGSVTATSGPTIGSDQTSVEYAVTLARPGDFYEFSVDIVNAGSLPGKISLATVSGLTGSLVDLVEYSVNYDVGSPVQVGDIINGGDTKTVIVRTYFKEDIDEEDLLSSNITVNLVFSTQFNQSDEDETNAGNLLLNLKNEGNTCITKYSGQVTDQVGSTVTASNVYIDGCIDKRNVIFGGFCWQIVRSTQTNGLKMVYNGIPVNDKCELARPNHNGTETWYVSDDNERNLSDLYLYGSSYTFDTTNNTFTLNDTVSKAWPDTNSEDLIGKYTCKNTNGTCSSLYYVTGFIDGLRASMEKITVINNVPYYAINYDDFNYSLNSVARVGYMFNKNYYVYRKNPITGTIKFGSNFTYSNNTYTVSGTTKTLSSNYYNQLKNTNIMYTCWNSSGTCNKISFITSIFDATSSSAADYIDLKEGKSVDDAENDLLWSNDVNRYNSTAKNSVDRWYKENMLQYSGRIEDTVYCNNRSLMPDFEGYSSDNKLDTPFKNFYVTSDLTCENETDQFAVSNNKAKLTYPVALIGAEEWLNVDPAKTNSLLYAEDSGSQMTMTPFGNIIIISNGNIIDASLNIDLNRAYVRPAITLKSNIAIKSGTGSKTDPWIIE